jgi:small subunit ribosomal protein S15
MVKKKTSAILEKFQQHEKDTGSVEVQVVALTAEINELQEHCHQNPKDFSSQRGLLKMVNQRKRFLEYLKHRKSIVYKELIKELGLRK